MPLDLKRLFGRKNAEIEINAVNLRWKGKMHSLPGLSPESRRFKITVPFTNKTEGESAIPGLKMQKEKEETIMTIEVSQPFKLERVAPQLPITIQKGEKVGIEIEMLGPDFAYSGPLTITLGSKAVENIKIEITKQLVRYSGVDTEIPNTAEVLALEKGMIFKKDIQLLKAVSFGTEVKSMGVNDPFRLVSTDPKTPFRITDGNSWIVALYIQAPDFSYAGPFELSIE